MTDRSKKENALTTHYTPHGGNGHGNGHAQVYPPPRATTGTRTTYRVALLVSTAHGAPSLHTAGAPADIHAELDSDKSVESYAKALRDAGHEVLKQEGNAQLAAWLSEVQPDICFNVCEGFQGDSREAQVPALLEMLGARYTGPTLLAAAVTHDKPTTKRILHYHGLPTPLFQVFERADAPLHPN